MKKVELVFRELLFAAEKKKRGLSQSSLSRSLGISLSTVNLALGPLRRMHAVDIRPRGLAVRDAMKILYYWASVRSLEEDVIYRTRSDKPVRKIESEMPSSVLFTSCSAYKFMFGEVPADYSEVYAYADPEEVMERFPQRSTTPNIFILKKDQAIGMYGPSITKAQLFVDLWNQREWYAKEFLSALEVRLRGILE